MTYTTKKRKSYRVELQCGHVRFYPLPPPPGDTIYCTSCDKQAVVGPPDAKLPGVRVIDIENGYESLRLSERNYQFTCLECSHEISGRGYYEPRDKMRLHIIRQHSSFGGNLVIEHGERLPKDAPPPF